VARSLALAAGNPERMWLAGVPMTAPGLDHRLGLLERVGDIVLEQLIAEAGVEAFAIAALTAGPMPFSTAHRGNELRHTDFVKGLTGSSI